MKVAFKIVLAFLFVAMGVGFVLANEFYIKEKVDTVEVVVAKETIDFKKPITAENVEVINVRRANVVENAVSVEKFKSLIGKYASIKIEKGTQIYAELIDTYNLVPDSTKGEFVAPIPKEWLFAVPGSLRRTYVADVYAIGDKDRAVVQALTKEAKKEGGHSKADKDAPIETDLTPSTEPILTNIRVASVKDSGNKEVKESEETSEATGTVAALEIIATEEMLDTVKTYMNDGYKLYVVYKFERSTDVASDESVEEEGDLVVAE